ncbi:MAG: APC family permease, partial [Mycolicibacterium sp.]
MAITDEPAVPAVGGKGLQAGALGLVGNVVIGLGAVAPAYSLAATLGYVVLNVQEKAPAMFVLAFIPMLLVAFAYKELSQDTPDCGTTFTWGTKAFGPWVGWIGGWGLAVSAIIVLANVSEIAAIYLYNFLGLDSLAESVPATVALGCFFIVAMTLVSARGIVVSERVQNVLIAIQFGVLITVSVIALIRVFTGTAGAQAISPQLSWLWPSGLDVSSIAAAVILCIFIYWGWDACLAVGEETKDPGRTPGIAALVTTVILVCTYVLVAFALQSFAGFSEVGIGLNNPNNTDDVLTVLGKPVAGAIAASALLLTVSVSALSSTQTTILPTARGTLSMAVYEAIPKR